MQREVRKISHLLQLFVFAGIPTVSAAAVSMYCLEILLLGTPCL